METPVPSRPSTAASPAQSSAWLCACCATAAAPRTPCRRPSRRSGVPPAATARTAGPSPPGPMPELPPDLEQPRAPELAEVIPFFNQRRSAVYAIAAAAIALVAFGGGYLAGHRGGGFNAARTIRMHGTAAAPDALASVQIGKA